MTTLNQLLAAPIPWKDWDQDDDLLAFLSDLQANILKGHGREHTANIFLSFQSMSPASIKALLERLSYLTTSALEQLRSAEAFKLTGVSGGRVMCVMLGRGAYQKLGTPAAEIPADAAFREGMRARGQKPTLRFDSINTSLPGLADPLPSAWESTGPWSSANGEPDAMILVADDDRPHLTSSVTAVQRVINGSGAKQLGIDVGLAQRRKQTGGDEKGEGIEHFGYVDGRSQPLFLKEDLLKEAQQNWSAEFEPSQFIIAEPSNRTPLASGSYFVYRKLEQNVKAFKDQEDALEALFTPPIGERAGALVVGRFEDGTPLVLHPAPQAGKPANDFNYDGDDDPLIAKCPFKAHIRKTNPRTGGDDLERRRIMARRGITFGQRAARKPDGDFSDEPTGGVGLIFMAYMADINEQFEFTQAAWAGNGDFQHPETGIDAVIGQQPNRPNTKDVEWFDKPNNQTVKFDFATSIKLVGGEYFYAPSISFLQQGP